MMTYIFVAIVVGACRCIWNINTARLDTLQAFADYITETGAVAPVY